MTFYNARPFPRKSAKAGELIPLRVPGFFCAKPKALWWNLFFPLSLSSPSKTRHQMKSNRTQNSTKRNRGEQQAKPENLCLSAVIPAQHKVNRFGAGISTAVHKPSLQSTWKHPSTWANTQSLQKTLLVYTNISGWTIPLFAQEDHLFLKNQDYLLLGQKNRLTWVFQEIKKLPSDSCDTSQSFCSASRHAIDRDANFAMNFSPPVNPSENFKIHGDI